MKKKLAFASFIALLLTLTFSLGVLAAPSVSVWFNNKAQKVDVRTINNKVYVPLTDVVSWFGGKVSYDKNANTYKVTSKDYKPAPSTLKSYSVNTVVTSGPMKMTISEVTVDPAYKYNQYLPAIKAVVLDVKVQNTSSNRVKWYPSMGTYALNTGEQLQDALLYSSDVEGEFLGNTVKTGKIVLNPKTSSLDAVNSIHMVIDGALDNQFSFIGKEVDTTLKFR
jgi:hypothetical protein